MVAAVLERPTLVLNRNWQPVGVATVARALVKVWNDTARIVDPADYQQYTWADWVELAPVDSDLFIQTQRLRLRVPEVVTLTRYDKLPVNAVTFSRRNVFKRDRFTCQYCGKKVQDLTLDHVIPRRQNGAHTWENVVTACNRCNLHKAGRTPAEAKMRLGKTPRAPEPNPYLILQNRVILEEWKLYIPWSKRES